LALEVAVLEVWSKVLSFGGIVLPSVAAEPEGELGDAVAAAAWYAATLISLRAFFRSVIFAFIVSILLDECASLSSEQVY